MGKTLDLTLRIWRQKNTNSSGEFVTYDLENVDVNASFLEMLDVLNEKLTLSGDEPVAFEHDCREGICGSCGAMVNGKAHGGEDKTTLCQLHMRHFKSGDVIVIEPFRAKALPVVKDFVAKIKERAVGQEVLKSLSPGQAFVKIVNDELIEVTPDCLRLRKTYLNENDRKRNK